ncbi:MAG: hypothetical protein EXS10_06165 [Phycisphaerales bacterium]|nr:hypothetical protein [Phycisphaerales bacterium]
MNRITHQRALSSALCITLFSLASCSGSDAEKIAATPAPDAHTEAAPTNRVEIPETVRRNLGITFAKVEPRNVASTLRVPGQFELLPTARHEYRAMFVGRIALLVEQYARVEIGTPLYRIESSDWRDLHESIASAQAKSDAMPPLREAHHAHARILEERARIWEARLEQLEQLRNAGGGGAAQFIEARAALNEAQVELAEVLEKEAEHDAQERAIAADLRALEARRALALTASGCSENAAPNALVICATASGRVESIAVTQGSQVEEAAVVLTTVQPELVRFRAKGLQSDLGRLREGLPVLIAPPQGGSLQASESMLGALTLGLSADANERTIDLVVFPERIAPWARAGVSASLEITIDGGGVELAIPLSAVVRDGVTPIIFRRDPANPDKAIRMEADLGVSDGRWVAILSGVKAGDEVIVDGNYQLMLATSGSAAKGGHFHSDGTFHEGKD